MTSTEGVALQVDDVYVPLGLVERKKQSKPQGDISPEQGSELYKETEITKTFEHDVFLEEVLKQKNTPKSQGKRIAIIGEPGAGKTTLLQQIADWVSREIDQSIVIWVSLADLRGKELKPYLLENWLTQVAQKTGKAEATKQLKDDFVALFNQNNVWLLLDGLDEMSASNPLTEIARQFREAGLISQARIVLTCRVNLWDGSTNALDDFDTYRSLDFSYPEQVERFIHKWFATIPETGKQLCTKLKESGKERIQDLVKNPLRLTLLCLNWQSGDGKLPDTQAGLYEQFVDDFYKWKKEEIPTTPKQRQQLNVKLGELAREAIDKEATRFRLRQDFVSRFLGDVEDENSLLKLALNRGWLNCVGIDTSRKPVYAFFHASFQEYFAAKAIDDWHFFLNHVRNNPSLGTYRIFETQWKQTILLWLGRPEENLKQQKQRFIDALVNFKDGIGKWNKNYDKGFYEYRAYVLAAAGIAEFRGYTRADKIVTQIVKWAVDDTHLIKEEAELVLQHIDRTKAIAALVQLLRSNDLNHHTCIQRASSLKKIGKGNEIAIAALVQLLQSNNFDDYTRIQVASSLGEIDTGNEIAITALAQLLLSPNLVSPGNNYEIPRRAAESLGEIGTGNEIAIASLVQLLLSPNLEWHNYTCRQAAESLKKIVPGNELLIANLVRLITDYTYSDTTKLAAESLEKIGAGNDENAIAALVQWLQSNDNNARNWAAYILRQIGIGNENAITALVQLLQSTNVDDDTRRQAAYSLGEIDPGNEIAIAALVQLLQSTNVNIYIRRQAAYSLGEIDTGNEIAIVALVQLLQSTNVDDDTRINAAYSLWEIDPGNEIAIAALVQLLQSTNVNIYIRMNAAYSLEEIDPGNKIAIPALVQMLLSNHMNDVNRKHIAECLIKIDPGNENAIAALLQLLQPIYVDDYCYTCTWVTKSLGQIGTGNKNLIVALVQLLQSTNLEEYTRELIARCLGQIGIGNENAIAALVQLLQSTNLSQDTRGEAAESLKKIGTGNKNAIVALVQLLLSTNVDHFTRKLAAQSLGEIGTGNEIAIVALVQLLLSTNVDHFTRMLAVQSLGKIGTGNKNAIAALVQLLQSTSVDKETCKQAAESLGEIGTGNENAISALVQLLQSTNMDDYNYTRIQAEKSLIKILQNNQQRFAVVKTLSGYNCYGVFWECAQNMPYPDFYQAWDYSKFSTRVMRSLKKILFTRI